MRRNFVGGNWKCNGTLDFMSKFPSSVLKNLSFNPNSVDVVVAPSTIHIGRVQQELAGTKVQLASQNCSLYGNGAYTGESSPQMIKDFGLDWVVLGHSERRHVFGETDNEVGLKTLNALNNNLSVIACIGEKLDEREANKVDEVNSRQLNAIREHVEDWSKIVIAYEPVWAIGTGVVASTEQAQGAHEVVRDWLKKNVSAEAADQTRILYGGSVTEKNCNELISQPDVDGFLVGGASLKDAFIDIVASCNKN
jgi:triosephosphate isomerase